MDDEHTRTSPNSLDRYGQDSVVEVDAALRNSPCYVTGRIGKPILTCRDRARGIGTVCFGSSNSI